MSDRLAAYQQFLDAKIKLDKGSGFEVSIAQINPLIRDFNKVMVQWALRGGRRALFASFGLHKTCCQLEKMRLIGLHNPCYRLIVLPLGVRQEFISDAHEFFQDGCSLTLKFIQSTDELEDQDTIYLTNYESAREGKIDWSRIGAVELDEADCLRSFGSKTFGEFLFGPVQRVPLRGVNTATPAPNDFQELIAYAHFLGVMDIGEARTRFFQRNSERADDLTLLPHKAQEFWFWVSSWALFVSKPSDLGFSDEGYELPRLDVRWHEVPSDHSDAGINGRGQGMLLREQAIGVVDASREKRRSMSARIEKYLELRAEAPDAHRLVWHDLEDERRAIEKAVPGLVTVYGSQPWDQREKAVVGFRNGEVQELGAKPVMLGAGCNMQKHCWWEIFLGVGFKFRDFIQAIHRIQRFGQQGSDNPAVCPDGAVRVDVIYSELERPVKDALIRKWRDHEVLVANMSAIVKEYGLSQLALTNELQRSMGVERQEISGSRFRMVRNDAVIESMSTESNSVDFIGTSIPFSTQYEYTPAFEDFGHTDDEAHFFRQMDFLTPELLRILKPGRVMAIHVKDRVVPGAITGLPFQSISPFHARALLHYQSHGFVFNGMITVVTDVVRENNGTYRLSWTQQCKDGSRMGCGMSEYILLFRKAPTDFGNGYADEPVTKTKEEYPLAQWQIDADGLWRSSGDRLLAPEDLLGRLWEDIIAMYQKHSKSSCWNYEREVEYAKLLDQTGDLPRDFKLLMPATLHPDVWGDVVRMRTLNTELASRRRDKHVCPLPLDICERLINRFSNPGEIVLDPFAGVGSFPKTAVVMDRIGWGWDLNEYYWREGVGFCKRAEDKQTTPTLFDLVEFDLAQRREAIA